MKLEFEWCGLKCLAIGGLEDGLFVPDTIDATGTLDSSQLSGEEFDNLISIMDEKCEGLWQMNETLYYFECPECGNYSPEGGWCEGCLDKVDIEEHEERRREWLQQQQEY